MIGYEAICPGRRSEGLQPSATQRALITTSRHGVSALAGVALWILPVMVAAPILVSTQSALALSEIKNETVPASPDGEPAAEPAKPDTGEGGIPAPEPIQKSPLPVPDPAQPATPAPAEPPAGGEVPAETPPAIDDETPPAEEDGTDEDESEDGGAELDPGGNSTRPDIDPDAPLPEIVYDVSTLPAPVKRMRELILEATKTGDIEQLRQLIGVGSDITQLSLGGIEGDPITFLKELSGDSEGQEILAILEEVLSAGYVHLDAGKPEELYVWPYFFAVPLERLTAPQRVELFKIVTAGDYEDMKSYGAYIFYRVGITPEGRWVFFVAGD